ncbi:MAG: HAD-IIB family hydrolase [Myxococcales bacterium]
MRYHLLACDYDGTIAKHGAVEPDTIAALHQVSESGRRVVLVTGRDLPDLLRVLTDASLFDWIVAENGGVLYHPETREEQLLAPEPSNELVKLLRQRGVQPLSVGRTIIATWEPNENIVLTAIRELGLELQVIFNKGAVMVLPASVNKRSGLSALLGKISISPHNCVGVGDAENDHAFLALCEFSVAVANALPALKQSVDWVATLPHGEGVRELVNHLLTNDLQSADLQPRRHRVTLGSFGDGAEFTIPAVGPLGLVAGASGAGKTTATLAILEQLAAREYQLCIIDPEGDYDSFPSAIVVGTADHPPDMAQIPKLLMQPTTHVVINLLAIPVADRPRFFMRLLMELQQFRGTYGHPHWIAVDEAHHVLDAAFEPTVSPLSADLESMLFVTVHPQRLHATLLSRIDFALTIGSEARSTLSALVPELDTDEGTGDASDQAIGTDRLVLWQRDCPRVVRQVTLLASTARQRRHRRKYAKGELGPDKSFYFRGVDSKLNLRAQNLVAFNELGAGVDDETWLFHLARGDYSKWIREAIKDDSLADKVAEVETLNSVSAQETRDHIRELIESIYTAPA